MAGGFCTRCGTQSYPGSQLCVKCGAPVNPASSISASPAPPPPPAWHIAPPPVPPPASATTPPAPNATNPAEDAQESTVKARRVAASSLVLIAAILLTVSMTVPWWGFVISAGGATASVNFLPGSSYSGSGTYHGLTYSSSATYASANLSSVGVLYEAVLGLGLTSAIAAFAGMALGYVSAIGTVRLRRPVGIAAHLTDTSFVFALALPFLVVFIQPWAYNSDSSGAGASCGGGSNPCNSFWGSISSGGVTGTWGAGAGWYIALIATILLLVAAVLFWRSEPKLYTRDEILGVPPQRAAYQGYPPGLLTPTSAPSVTSSVVYVQPAVTSSLPAPLRFCPFCGTSNGREYSYCQKCGQPLPPPL
jgi:hypothetical protein